jgi:hypothetical protein
VLNHSAENIAKYFYDEISRQMNGGHATPARRGEGPEIARVDVWETDTSRASYFPEESAQAG